MPLCSYCESLKDALLWEPLARHGDSLSLRTYAVLATSAEQGCRLCQIFVEALARHCIDTGNVRQEDSLPIYPVGKLRISRRETGNWTRAISTEEGRDHVGSVRTLPIEAAWKNLRIEEDTPVDGIATATIDEWINTCNLEHTRCSSHLEGVDLFMPSRVLDVRSTSPGTIRLVKTSSADIKDWRYVAVSHCWGTTMPSLAKTTQEVLSAHYKGIRLCDLTTTFRDVVKITQKLGLRYLWIDSLCIVQDSAEDWENESSQMANIYLRSYLTLAASGSADGTGGCRVGEIGKDMFWPCVDVSVRDYSGEDGGGSGEDEAKGFKKWRINSWAASAQLVTERDPLQQRGWTLQERWLSPRVACYSKDTVRWECRVHRASLHSPWNDHYNFGTAGPRAICNMPFWDHLSQFGKPLTNDESMVLLNNWLEAIEVFTTRNLTFQSDMLPAITGIARVFTQRFASDYHAGIILAHGLLCLLWASDPTTHHREAERRGKTMAPPPHRRPGDYVAPSWSWASVMGAVRHVTWYRSGPETDPEPMEELATIHSMETSPAGRDAMGRVKDGVLRMRGTIWPLSVKRAPQEEGGSHRSHDVFGSLRGTETKLGSVVFDVEGEACDEIRCLPCMKIGRWPNVFGLALVSTEGNPSGSKFRRVGRFRTGVRILNADGGAQISDIEVI